MAATPAAETSLTRLVYEPGDPLMAWGAVQLPRPPAPGMPPSSRRTFSAGFGNVAGPFVPDYCRYPPVPNAAYLQPQPDSLVLLQLSTAGPRYAQNVIFRWDLGDGTVVERNTGGVVRHRYAPGRVPGPGTAVRLTLTNNLGCTATQTLYPWGRPTAAQQARALGAQATLWPNPAAGTATLALAEAPAGGATVQVLDALGRVLQTRTLPAGAAALTLDVGGLAAGVYAVRVSAVAGSFAKRLVRE